MPLNIVGGGQRLFVVARPHGFGGSRPRATASQNPQDSLPFYARRNRAESACAPSAAKIILGSSVVGLWEKTGPKFR